ncbi:hypothetical protein GW17_00040336, partial [Ensete ventricosum]
LHHLHPIPTSSASPLYRTRERWLVPSTKSPPRKRYPRRDTVEDDEDFVHGSFLFFFFLLFLARVSSLHLSLRIVTMMMMVPSGRGEMTQEAVAEKAVAAIGCGYDLCSDLWLSHVKPDPEGRRLIELDQTLAHDLVLPGGVVVPNVPKSIKCDRGSRTRFRSDVISFHQKDASATKSLAFDAWYITLYGVELVSSRVVLLDKVKQEVPSSWDPAALAE